MLYSYLPDKCMVLGYEGYEGYEGYKGYKGYKGYT